MPCPSTEESASNLPFFEEAVQAGFPSPASGEACASLSLNDLCIRHPQATYFLRVRGDSMINAGIAEGDVLVVDRALDARNGDVVIASLNGEFMVKRLQKTDGQVRLISENPAYPPIEIYKDSGAEFFGVVSSVVKLLRT